MLLSLSHLAQHLQCNVSRRIGRQFTRKPYFFFIKKVVSKQRCFYLLQSSSNEGKPHTQTKGSSVRESDTETSRLVESVCPRTEPAAALRYTVSVSHEAASVQLQVSHCDTLQLIQLALCGSSGKSRALANSPMFRCNQRRRQCRSITWCMSGEFQCLECT